MPTDFVLAPADGYVAVAAGQLLLVDLAGGQATPAPIQGWTGPDRQLHIASDDLELTATGQAVPDVLELLQPLSDGRVAFGGAQFGRGSRTTSRTRKSAKLHGLKRRRHHAPGRLPGRGPRRLHRRHRRRTRGRDLSPNADTGPAPAGRTPHAVASWFDVDGSDEGVLTFSTHPTPEHPDRVEAPTTVDGSAVTGLAAGDRWIIARTERHRRPVFARPARRTARRAVDGARR